ncbi:L-lactate permease [Brevibacterium luteolum]|uniref:L-lactate permease n=1 Tax=Brevibacterium luteolum TaxID=199591 RepID=UPI0021AFCBCB|nr:L-lactate permease [Brevibacterium luteolum]MCT1657312.1 L-lactate permease [Brevibacterium luteolum]
MTTLLSILPIAVAVAVLVAGRGTLIAALSGAGAALLSALIATATPGISLHFGQLAASETLDLVILAGEVLAILLFGMVLAQLLEAIGALQTISARIRSLLPDPIVGAGLIVFGVVPFVESVTGYGIGLTAGIPLLRRLGFSICTSAFLGLLGLIAVPWGALGPGTAVAAQLTGLGLQELGVGSAWANALPVVIVFALTTAITRAWRSLPGLVGLIAAAVCLWGGILTANILIGTPLAGVLGSLLVIAVLLTGCLLSRRGQPEPVPGRLAPALLPYAVLTVGLLLASGAAALWPSPMTAVLSAPPVWLAIACAVAARMLASRASAAEVVGTAARAWIPVGVATAGFMLLGWLMTDTGMTEVIGAGLARIGIGFAPALTALGSVLTGSNTGSNAMFASTIAAMAATTGTGLLPAVAMSNVAGSFAALATPPRVALALSLAATTADDDGSAAPDSAEKAQLERSVLIWSLLTAFGTAGLVGVVLQLL